jgi:hypothetical protein
MTEMKTEMGFSDEYLTQKIHEFCAPFTQFKTLSDWEKSGIIHASLLLIATHVNATRHATVGAIENAKYDLLSRDILKRLQTVDETLDETIQYIKNFKRD